MQPAVADDEQERRETLRTGRSTLTHRERRSRLAEKLKADKRLNQELTDNSMEMLDKSGEKTPENNWRRILNTYPSAGASNTPGKVTKRVFDKAQKALVVVTYVWSGSGYKWLVF